MKNERIDEDRRTSSGKNFEVAKQSSKWRKKENEVDPDIYYNEYPLFEEFDKQETIVYSRYHGRDRYCICCCNVTSQASIIFMVELWLSITMLTYQGVRLGTFLHDPPPPPNTLERKNFDYRVLLNALMLTTEAFGFTFSLILAAGVLRKKVPLVIVWILSAPIHTAAEITLVSLNWEYQELWHEIFYVILKTYWMYVMYHYYDILKFDQALRDHHLQKKRVIAHNVLIRARAFVKKQKLKTLKNLQSQRLLKQKDIEEQAKIAGISNFEIIPISPEEERLEKRLLELAEHNPPFTFLVCCKKLKDKNNPNKITPNDRIQDHEVHLVNLDRKKKEINRRKSTPKKIKHVYEIPIELLLAEHRKMKKESREKSPNRLSVYFPNTEDEDDVDRTAKWIQESSPGSPSPRSSL